MYTHSARNPPHTRQIKQHKKLTPRLESFTLGVFLRGEVFLVFLVTLRRSAIKKAVHQLYRRYYSKNIILDKQ